MSSGQPKQVVILGAGVIGLTIAHVLTSCSPDAYKITIVARDMPEDLHSQGFSSPWAGANWAPIGEYSPQTHKREAFTFNKMWDMIPTGLVLELPSRIYFDTAENLDQLWYRDLVRDFRVLEPGELPAFAKGGVQFKTISVNPEIYLPWLQSQLVERGVQFVRRKVHSLGEAAALVGSGGVLVNATALGARSLIGVEDTNVYPIRGQTVIVYAPAVKEFIGLSLNKPSPDGQVTYMIPRPAPEGHVLLGGTYQMDNWDTSLDIATAKGIIKRNTELNPALGNSETRVLSHNVGLRPARRGGARIEAEWIDIPHTSEILPLPAAVSSVQPGKVLVVHSYGFGPAGYQNSWGAAQEAVELLEANLTEQK